MKEIIHTLETMKNQEDIKQFILRQDHVGCELLANTLRYADPETERLWLDTYSQIFKP